MFCPKCGKELREYERSCPYCGAAAAHGNGKRHRIKPTELFSIVVGTLALIVHGTCISARTAEERRSDEDTDGRQPGSGYGGSSRAVGAATVSPFYGR